MPGCGDWLAFVEKQNDQLRDLLSKHNALLQDLFQNDLVVLTADELVWLSEAKRVLAEQLK